ncbi:MAG: cation:proton antiporter [Campylobacteraceae bacterium]|nr:cation:proton antiporter [Campylobacteraceae bacterium]
MEHGTGLLVLLFVIGSILIGALTMISVKGTKLPYTVALLLLGLALGGLDRVGFFHTFMPIVSESIALVVDIDPHLFLFVFLPTLIFESAYSLEVHLFKRIFSQIATLAIPGLIVSTMVTATLVKYFFPWDWSWELCFMFGALISATDPVAVVALLKEVSSRKRLETLIEGESLLNDGTAIVLFTLFYGMVISTSPTNFDFLGVVGEFSFVVLLGLAIGIILGYLAILLISKVFNNPLVEISLSVAVAYMVFFIAENTFHVSGVVALVSLALMFSSVGRTKISPEVAGFLHHFWEMMAHFANTLIFLLVGVLIIARIKLDSVEYWVALFVLYIGITIVRAGSVGLFMPILSRIGIGITKEKAIVLVWGGLRGAVSLALALVVAQNTSIPKEIGDQILFLTAGIVVLTILINGLTMEKLLAKLGLDKLPPAKEATVQKAKSIVYNDVQKYLPDLKNDEFLQNVEWESISEINKLEVVHDKAIHEEKEDITKEDLSIAFRRRLLETERKYYWETYKGGTLSADAAKSLASVVEEALDEYPTITPRPMLDQLWHTPKYYQLFENVPVLDNIFLKFSFTRIALGYEIARGFVDAQEEILAHVDNLSPNEEANKSVREDIMRNKQMTFNYIANISSVFPEIVCAIQTRTANRLLLNRERSVIKKLLEAGVLDTPEASRMIEDVEARMFSLLKMPNKVAIPEVSTLIKQASWTKDIKETTLNELIKLFEHHIYSEHEYIYNQDKQADKLMVIVRGSIEIINEDTNEVEDIKSTGATLGVDVLFRGASSKSIKTTLTTDILFINIEKLKLLMKEDTVLSENLKNLSETLINS